jgi:hypothetical protein
MNLFLTLFQSDVSDIANEGPVAFHFTLGGHKHTFEANTLSERDNWVSVLKTKVAEAKELAPTVKEHETYKQSHSTLSKPFVAAAAVATPKKSTEAKKEEKTEVKKEEKAEAKEEEKKEVKERKSRSASRKRTSIFGSIPGFGKKEEKVESKEETPVVAPAAEPAATGKTP